MRKVFIIDFDSTFTKVEALDELASISLKEHSDKKKILQEISNLTDLAMEGKLSFSKSLSGRIALLQANKNHLNDLVKILRKKISESFARNKSFIKKNAEDILIVSGGFKEFIVPVLKEYRIPEKNIYANTFKFDTQGTIIGYDTKNPLSEEGGKVKLIKGLNLQAELYGIGDGHSDFQLKESGLIKKFYAFTENISRKSVAEKSDHITPSFDEFLYLNKLPMSISYPKNRILTLIIGDVHSDAIQLLKKDGLSIRHKKTFEDKYVKDVGILILADGEKLSTEKIQAADTLKVIGYLGNSKHTLSSEQCCTKGIVIFDDPRKKKNNFEFIPKRVLDFINTGSTHMSSNFPTIQLPDMEDTHRFIHIHHNVPGVLASINTIFAEHKINIEGQYLRTNNQIGYMITDVNKAYDPKVINALKKVGSTIKFRILY